MSPNASTTAAKDGEFPSLLGLVVRNKLIALGVVAVVALLLFVILVAVLGPKAGAVSDSTTCTQWGSANVNQQAAYAKLYLKEHGAPQGGGRSPASVITAINDGCTQAYGDDVSDTTTVVQAISGDY